MCEQDLFRNTGKSVLAIFRYEITGTMLFVNRAVTVAYFYHRGGNGPTTAGGAVLWYIYIYIQYI